MIPGICVLEDDESVAGRHEFDLDRANRREKCGDQALSVWFRAAVLADQSTRLATEPDADSPTPDQLDHQIQAAVLAGNRAFMDPVLSEDFRFFMATGKLAERCEMLSGFVKAGAFSDRRLTAVSADVHDELATTKGRIEVQTASGKQYAVCHLRFYPRADRRWRLVSQHTFRGRVGFAEDCAPLSADGNPYPTQGTRRPRRSACLNPSQGVSSSTRAQAPATRAARSSAGVCSASKRR